MTILTLTNPGGSPTTVTPTFYVSTATPTAQANQTTVPNFPSANPRWGRLIQASNEYIFIKRGPNTFAVLVDDLVTLGIARVPALSWVPIIDTQPVNATCVASSTAATFTVVSTITETTLSYQWQYYNGSAWANATGTINGCVYTNGTTATLTCTPTTTGQTGKLHRCVVTNLSGSTNTSSVTLTITAT